MAEATEPRKLQGWRPLAKCPVILYHILSGNYIELACHICNANSNKRGEFFNGPMGLLQHLFDSHKVNPQYDARETKVEFLENNCKARNVDWGEALQIEEGKATIQQYRPPSDPVPKPQMDLVLRYVEKRPLTVQFRKDGIAETTWRRLFCAICECDGANAKMFFDGVKGLREYMRNAHELTIPDGAATAEFIFHYCYHVKLSIAEMIETLDDNWTRPVKVYNNKKLNKEAKANIESWMEYVLRNQKALAEKHGVHEEVSEGEEDEESDEEVLTEFPAHTNLVIRVREHKK